MNLGSLFLFLALLSSAEAADKYAYLLGGGGEPKGESTIFDSIIKTFAQKTQNAGYQLKGTLFDGGHGETERILSNLTGVPQTATNTFSKKNFDAFVSQLEKDIDSGKFVKGDQVLFYLDTHGRKTTGPDIVHHIACDDGPCDTKQLQSIFSKLASKGIKTAFIDGSCYGGQSLPLGGQNTCVLTSANRRNPATSGCTEDLFSNLKQVKSMEAAFLAARKDCLSYPQISTPAGKFIHEILDPLLAPPESSRFRYIDSGVFDDISCPSCASKRTEDILQGLVNFEKVVAPAQVMLLQSSEYREFKNNILEYHKQLEGIVQLVNELNLLGKNKITVENNEYTWAELATQKPDSKKSAIKYLDELINTPKIDQKSKADFIKSRSRLEKMEAVKDSLKESAQFSHFLKLQADYDQHSISQYDGFYTFISGKLKTPLATAAMHVRNSESALYEKLYKEMSEVNSKEPNPCRDFLF